VQQSSIAVPDVLLVSVSGYPEVLLWSVFGVPSHSVIGVGVFAGQHIFLTARVNGEPVIKAYTPVSSDDDKGFMDLVVKVSVSSITTITIHLMARRRQGLHGPRCQGECSINNNHYNPSNGPSSMTTRCGSDG